MKRPDKEPRTGEEMEAYLVGLSEPRKKALIKGVLEGEDGEKVAKIMAGLLLLGYAGHVFEASAPSGKRVIKITAEYVDEE